MNIQTRSIFAWLAVTVSVAAAAAEPAVRNDVFARPKLASEAPTEAASTARVTWHPTLRAVVLAGDRSLVKVGNVVVELGGEIDGFRLVRVADDRAVFIRGRQRVELTMSGAVEAVQ